MIATQPSDDIGAFLEFLAATLGEDVVRSRQAARREDIEKFAALAKLPLPPLYLAYLQEFGANDGALKMADDANPRITALIELYEENVDSASDVPPHLVVIGAYGLSERSLLYADDWNTSSNGIVVPEPQVAVSWWGDVSHCVASNFRNHLYRQAFLRGCTAVGSHCSLYRNDPAWLPRSRQHVEALGFVAHWFSDDHQCCLERDDGSFFYIEHTNQRTSLYGCLRDAHTRDQVKASLLSSFDLTDSQPSN